MRTRNILCIAAVGAMLLVSGCGKKTPQTATLTLPSNLTTGYTWEVTQTEPLFEVASEYPVEAHEEDMVGVGGAETFVLTPKEKGTTQVTFAYGQHWEGGNAADSLTYEMEIDKNLQIKILTEKGEIPGNADTVPDMPEIVLE